MTIDSAWKKLKEIRRKIISAKPTAKAQYDDETLMMILISALPKSYQSTIDSMSIHENLPIEVQLTHLETKEDRLRIESNQIESANAARRRPQPSTSDVEMGGINDIDCYLCHDNHYLVECPFLKEAEEFVRGLKAQQKSKKYRKRKPVVNSARKGKGKYTRKSQGLVSTNFDESLDDEGSSYDESTNNSEPETAAISTQNRSTPRDR
ncbi:hypothetical protein K3495_g16292 [Podosphaera aphanis]|nr:hypothetical protein K3495_g16292 [Podosphaera aphanis]